MDTIIIKKVEIEDIVTIEEFFPEGENGGDTIHNHFDCPVCERKYAGINVNHAMYEDDWTEEGKTFRCEHCGTEFAFVPNGTEIFPDIFDSTKWKIVGLPRKARLELVDRMRRIMSLIESGRGSIKYSLKYVGETQETTFELKIVY